MANKRESTAIIFRIETQSVVHVIHGDRIHTRVKRWLKRQGWNLNSYDYYIQPSA